MSKSKNAVIEFEPYARLPVDGLSRWGDIKHLIPVSKEKWRQLIRDGYAPPVTRLGIRCSFQSNCEILRWLSDPLSYRAKKEGVDTLLQVTGIQKTAGGK
jgi:hypothetical protein